tara:strand:+ start:832 stop:1317 length:486 start_codon:yes stop_codon:yes gene_type:complete
MAYIFSNIDKLDINPSIGVGIRIPFDGQTGITTLYTTQETIKSNLLNFILTNKRERLMNPGFGAGLLGLAPSLENPEGDSGVLFNQLTEERIDQIENLIIGGIEANFPDVTIIELKVNLSPDSQTTEIYLNYTITNTNIEDELLITYGLGIGDTFNNNRII